MDRDDKPSIKANERHLNIHFKIKYDSSYMITEGIVFIFNLEII